MKSLHEKQKKILEYLLENSAGATLQDISDHLGITKTAAKEHIVRLESLGYLTYQDSRGEVGRPKRRYLLSPEGNEVFPRQYSWLSTVLLELLAENSGSQGVSELMRNLAKKVSDSMAARFSKCKTSAELFGEITAALNELGYRAQLKQSDIRKGAVIEATNCVYHSVAKKHPELCQFDTQFIKNASGMNVRLESCISKGDAVCRFCINKKS
jgi:DeoR family transcriptional regulator, suf operon transcriptional repressor